MLFRMKKLRKSIFRFAKKRVGEARARRMAMNLMKLRYKLSPRPSIRIAQAIKVGENSLFLQGQIVDIRKSIVSIDVVFANRSIMRIDDSIRYLNDQSTMKSMVL